MSADSKSDTETSGRRFGQSPDTLLVPIGASAEFGPLQEELLAVSIHKGWTLHGGYENAGYKLGRFINNHACYKFRMALREELGDG